MLITCACLRLLLRLHVANKIRSRKQKKMCVRTFKTMTNNLPSLNQKLVDKGNSGALILQYGHKPECKIPDCVYAYPDILSLIPV